jgi:hypothetical protein
MVLLIALQATVSFADAFKVWCVLSMQHLLQGKPEKTGKNGVIGKANF